MSSVETDHMVTGAGQTLPAESEYPRESEGILLPEAWHFDVGVEKITPKKGDTEPADQWGNVVSRWTVHMEDGVKLGLNFCEPKERTTNIAVIETPAWFTNLHGFNEHTQRALGSLGIPSLLVGHVGQERDGFAREVGSLLFKPWQTVREMRGISLARQAHNMLEIFKHAGGSFMLDPDNIFLHGNSRGAMVQFPEIAMAHERGINVVFAMPVAPCFAKGFDRETARELRQTPRAEVWNVGKLIARNLFDMTGSGANTINASPKSIVYELAHTDSLLNGDAGRFAHLTPEDQNMLILAYESDFAGQRDEWERLYENHPNVNVRGVPGAHLSIADKRTRSFVMRTFDKYVEQLRDGEAPNNLDHSHTVRPQLSIVKN